MGFGQDDGTFDLELRSDRQAQELAASDQRNARRKSGNRVSSLARTQSLRNGRPVMPASLSG